MNWYRWFPMDRIIREVKFEVEHGIRYISLQSEDYFRYGSRDLSPSIKAVELAEAIASIDGLRSARPNFATASTVIQNPRIVEKLQRR